MAGIVYILTNPVMPGAVKIGRTGAVTIIARMKKLSSATGVPVPFDCTYAAKVANDHEVEKVLHALFADSRIAPNREFFWVDTKKAIGALKEYEIEDATPEARQYADLLLSEAQKAARRAARQKYEREHPEIEPGKDLHKTVKPGKE